MCNSLPNIKNILTTLSNLEQSRIYTAYPASTVTTVDHHALVSAQLVGCGGRAGQGRPRDASGADADTITAKGTPLSPPPTEVKLRGECTGSATDVPVATITGGGTRIGEVRAPSWLSTTARTARIRTAAIRCTPSRPRIVSGLGDRGRAERYQDRRHRHAANARAARTPCRSRNSRRLPTNRTHHGEWQTPCPSTHRCECGETVFSPPMAALVRANVPEIWPA